MILYLTKYLYPESVNHIHNSQNKNQKLTLKMGKRIWNKKWSINLSKTTIGSMNQIQTTTWGNWNTHSGGNQTWSKQSRETEFPLWATLPWRWLQSPPRRHDSNYNSDRKPHILLAGGTNRTRQDKEPRATSCKRVTGNSRKKRAREGNPYILCLNNLNLQLTLELYTCTV